MQIELCSFSSSSLVKAPVSPALRIELCSNFYEGGTTPSIFSFLKVIETLPNPVFVMIRPRGGDFLYTDEEFEIMKAQLLWFKENGAKGFVLGLLNSNGTVAIERTKILVQLAAPLPVTFHRAFDTTLDLNRALEAVIKTGCTRLLSSGGAANVNLGFTKLLELHKQANGRIALMPGGGVNLTNVKSFMEAGFTEIHLSSKKMTPSKMQFKSSISMTANDSISSFDYVGIDFDNLYNFTNYVRQIQIP